MAEAGGGGGRGSTAAVHDGGEDEEQGVGEESVCEDLRDVRRGTVPEL